jgi:ribosomal protein S18 acetylase RimI-like enzyme
MLVPSLPHRKTEEEEVKWTEVAPKISDAIPSIGQAATRTFQAPVHKVLTPKVVAGITLEHVEFRMYDKSRDDMEEIRALHEEFFPTSYNDEFYTRIREGKSACMLVLWTHSDIERPQSSREYIVGLMVYDIRMAKPRHYQQTWSEYFFGSSTSIYILTLGVVYEFRKKGLASKMWQHFLDTHLKRDRELKYIYLHSIEYNATANQFYERLGFLFLKKKRELYTIDGKKYDGFTCVYYVNEAKPPKAPSTSSFLTCFKANP